MGLQYTILCHTVALEVLARPSVAMAATPHWRDKKSYIYKLFLETIIIKISTSLKHELHVSYVTHEPSRSVPRASRLPMDSYPSEGP
jgi:hypothetical protein